MCNIQSVCTPHYLLDKDGRSSSCVRSTSGPRDVKVPDVRGEGGKEGSCTDGPPQSIHLINNWICTSAIS